MNKFKEHSITIVTETEEQRVLENRLKYFWNNQPINYKIGKDIIRYCEFFNIRCDVEDTNNGDVSQSVHTYKIDKDWQEIVNAMKRMDERIKESNEPEIIGVRTLCEHADKCPSLAYLSKQQLKLWQALQECNMQAVLNMDWTMVYQTLKTFETLGLITYPCEIVSSYQLKQMKLKLIDRTCSCRLSNPNYPND